MAGTEATKQQSGAGAKQPKQPKPQKQQQSCGGKKKEVKKETGLGLTNKKADNFGEWYSEV
jgi:prolyl-tRNA synthetase